jgi:hypothetical protein
MCPFQPHPTSVILSLVVSSVRITGKLKLVNYCDGKESVSICRGQPF